MSLKTPKTGLAGKMRDWMSARGRKFRATQLYDALDMPPGRSRLAAQNALGDFIARGEVIPLGSDRRSRENDAPWHLYNPAWRRRATGVVNRRIFKAMRLISFRETFTAEDIQRLAGADRSWVMQSIRLLVRSGHVGIVGDRVRPTGGRERLYRVLDTDKFFLEVMR